MTTYASAPYNHAPGLGHCAGNRPDQTPLALPTACPNTKRYAADGLPLEDIQRIWSIAREVAPSAASRRTIARK
jgi:hypothetical protein